MNLTPLSNQHKALPMWLVTNRHDSAVIKLPVFYNEKQNEYRDLGSNLNKKVVRRTFSSFLPDRTFYFFFVLSRDTNPQISLWGTQKDIILKKKKAGIRKRRDFGSISISFFMISWKKDKVKHIRYWKRIHITKRQVVCEVRNAKGPRMTTPIS